MIKKSKSANDNYLAKIVKLKGVTKHPNADRLQVVKVDFQNVITDLSAKDGDLYVYFPVESRINHEFLSFINAFRDKSLNKDEKKKGFFESNCRVKATNLRGEKSMGFIIPLYKLEEWSNIPDLGRFEGKEFDTVGNELLLDKYQIEYKKVGTKESKKDVRLNRLVDNQVHLHVDTSNIRRSMDRINLDDNITITYKFHGTSAHFQHVLVKKKLSFLYKVLKKLGVNITDTEYDIVYGSRRVIKNKYIEDPKRKDHFYSYDLWGEVTERIKGKIPKGFCIYGEIVGWTKDHKPIQQGYPYKCLPGRNEMYVYRVSFTNPDGIVTELSSEQVKEFCKKYDLKSVPILFQGTVKEYLKSREVEVKEDWKEAFINLLEKEYNEKDCYICKNGMPEEGVVIRKESLFDFEAYKLKSFRFLQHEGHELDKGVIDIESKS